MRQTANGVGLSASLFTGGLVWSNALLLITSRQAKSIFQSEILSNFALNSFNAHLAKPISLLGFTIFRINPV